MPVLLLHCPDCHHGYRSLVMEGTKVPEVWTCSRCGGRDVEPVGQERGGAHPLGEDGDGACCG